MTKEERSEYNKKYYESHKKKIRDRQNEYYAKKNADKPKRVTKTEEEKLEKRRERYRKKTHTEEKHKNKRFYMEYEKRHKGFKFRYKDGVISFEVTLPFRVMEIRYHVNRIDEEAYKTLDKELKSKLRAIDPTKTIIIFEPSNIQYYTKNIEAIDDVAEAVKEFIKEKTEIYGKYKFRGRYIGIQL